MQSCLLLSHEVCVCKQVNDIEPRRQTRASARQVVVVVLVCIKSSVARRGHKRAVEQDTEGVGSQVELYVLAWGHIPPSGVYLLQ